MKTAIIGGGASGLFVAAVISKYCDVTVYDHNEKPGKKIYITGKGRCNFTNLCSVSEFLASVVRGQKFLISAISSFTPQNAIDYFGSIGLKSVVERGNRAFPESGKASDVTAALVRATEAGGGKIRLNSHVESVKADGGGFEVTVNGEKYRYDKVVLATGGVSYKSTGSTGDGYKFAKSMGHNIIPPVEALCPLVLREDVSSLEGLSLKNVSVKVTAGKKSFEKFGEMLFTHNGVSGPCILTLSSLINRIDGAKTLSIDLKPALSQEEVDKRLLRDFNENINRDFKNSLNELLPKSLIPYIIKQSGISPDKKVNSVTKAERSALVQLVKGLTFAIERAEGFDSAVVTSGGVDTKQVDPKTMESKLVPGLYIVGELLDVDALTGGYNLHIAWATAAAAARGILKEATN